jgi:threonine aldolase
MGIDMKEFTKHVDNLMFCLSKGLSCPIGSIVVGSHEFIEKARKARKILGGGMRQAGIIAAPGIIALEKMVDRLREDHINARMLAEGLARIEGISVSLKAVQTNIVQMDVSGLGITANQFVSKLKEKGILALSMSKSIVRIVTHRGIEKKHIEKTLDVIKNIVEEMRY